MVGKTESAEHGLMRKALADWFTTQGLSNVKTPADPVADMVPDVQADYFAKIVYGEAKLCEDFATPDTKDELLNYCGSLPSEYKLVLGIPKGCEPTVQRALTEWGFTHRIQLVAL
ncbi:MAG: hypothetical protein E6K03_05035 [Methanobacteriota archaeon]|nr:MAG: hypothetical protein E6K03_05035 [Euryarchaeota archaeon]